MRLFSGFYCCLMVVFIITGCTQFPRKNYAWVQEWLKTSTCPPPCWEGITPGKTTLYDISATTISEKYKLRFNEPVAFPPTAYYFLWTNTKGNDQTTAVSAGTVSMKDMTIDSIEFKFGHLGSLVTVDDVISRFGEPDLVGLKTEMLRCEAVLFYENNHVWLELEGKPIKESYLIDKNTHLTWSYYLSDNARDERLELFQKPELQIITWGGYGNYPCKKNW